MLILFMALKIINQNYFFFFKNNYKNINLFLNFINLIKLILMINLFNNQDIYFRVVDWGLGIGPNHQSSIPNPQSQIICYLDLDFI
jgi:hypothetical protein